MLKRLKRFTLRGYNMRYAVHTLVGGISAVLGYLTGYIELFGLLLLCMTADFISGIIKAYILKKLSSRRCGIGVLKKTLILQAIVLVHYFTLITDKPETEAMVIWFWVAVEMLSVIENMADCGLPIPKQLKTALLQIKGDEHDNK